MGKVGSSSIYDSLRKKIPRNNLFHVHFLTEHWLRNIKDSYTLNQSNKALKAMEQFPNKKIKVITSIREPVSRDISAIFQNFRSIFNESDVNKINKGDVISWLGKQDHKYPERWFAYEFKKFFNIDILQHSFSPEPGYAIYNLKKIDILIFKLEKFEQCFSCSIKDFLGINVSMSKSNRTKNKNGYKLYKYLQSNYRLSEKTLESIYYTNFMRHFYSTEEIEKFIAKWGYSS